MIYGYARVSTRLQATDGNSLESQEGQLREAGASQIYQDTFTGTKSQRPGLDERAQEGSAIARLNPEYRDGRKKKYSRAQIKHALELLESHSYKQVESLTGISKSTLIRAKNAHKKELEQ